jgi:hypothetical protein
MNPLIPGLGETGKMSSSEPLSKVTRHTRRAGERIPCYYSQTAVTGRAG